MTYNVFGGKLNLAQLNSGRYRGLACVLSQMWQAITPGLGRLGVVRAAGVDNRWQGPAVLYEVRTLAPCQINQTAKLGS